MYNKLQLRNQFCFDSDFEDKVYLQSNRAYLDRLSSHTRCPPVMEARPDRVIQKHVFNSWGERERERERERLFYLSPPINCILFHKYTLSITRYTYLIYLTYILCIYIYLYKKLVVPFHFFYLLLKNGFWNFLFGSSPNGFLKQNTNEPFHKKQIELINRSDSVLQYNDVHLEECLKNP